MTLDQASEGTRCVLRQINGAGSFRDRAKSIGLVEGTALKVVRNEPKMPVLVYARDTLLAVNRKDAAQTEVAPTSESEVRR